MPDHQYTLTYDYISSFHEEWTFLLQLRWTKVKALYIIARYVPFSLVTADLYMIFAPNKDADAKCWMLMNIYSCLGVVSLTFSESMLFTLFAITVSFIGFWFATSDATTSTISGTVGCSWNMHIIHFSMPFLPSFVFALGLFFLALICVIQSWRTARGPLGAILVQHNMFYYTCSLSMNDLTPVLFSYVVSEPYTLQHDYTINVLHAQTANFLEQSLSLQYSPHACTSISGMTNWHVNDPEALCISMSDMLPADRTV
ncbi:uncharacterized protein F5891DRAFT_1175476 [Suillus fuscotomentosus]|uniref:DUF6533 domain-containing protein n=1 Tax=Suillus fuscotomentosus TaxID=1912939 RepID=A0AAD4DXB3_9AGAM|nr:uncharacterized protein F5891DRAFT_1175476 [Suillus fuscotomentosus]KAG1895810.1 hypothetical protein F5891DRAFT_1175476 [Suillus fuscotomentosus]